MSNRVCKFMRIDDSRKFHTVDEATKEANRIREKVKREAEKNDYAVQMFIGISEMDGKSKKRVSPHLHIMIYACPCETVAAMIVSCINTFQRKHGFDGGATKHDFNGPMHVRRNIPYIIKQSRKVRYLEYDPRGILSDFNIKEEAEKINPRAFRNYPSKNTDEDMKIYKIHEFPQLPCNGRVPRIGVYDYSTAEGGAWKENPEEKYEDIIGKERKTESDMSFKTKRVSRTRCSAYKPPMKKSKSVMKRKYSARRKVDRKYEPLITREEWLSKTPIGKAHYYNSLHMGINFFAFNMHMKKQSIMDDFKQNKYHYNYWERKFKTTIQMLVENYRDTRYLITHKMGQVISFADCE